VFHTELIRSQAWLINVPAWLLQCRCSLFEQPQSLTPNGWHVRSLGSELPLALPDSVCESSVYDEGRAA
jgi:hypothetical protein